MIGLSAFRTFFSVHNRILSFALLSVFALANFFTNFRLSRFDPDIHHDGYVLAGAIAASEGLVPNRDFLAQYGPLGPFFQGIWLQFTSPTLLNLRILNALLVTLNFTIAIILIARKWNFRFSILAVSTVAFSYPSVLTPMVPWTSVILTSSLLIALVSLQSQDSHSGSIYSSVFFFAGVILGVGFYIRIHAIFVVVSLATFLVLQKNWSRLTSLLTGFILIVSVATLIQWRTNSLSDFVNQVFLAPFISYTGDGGYPPKTQIVNLFLFLSCFIYLSLFLVVILGLKRFLVKSQKSRFGSLLLSVIFLLASTLAYSYGIKIPEIAIEDRSFRNPQYFLYYFCNNWRHVIGYCALALLLLQLRRILWNFKLRNMPHSYIFLFFAFGVMAQLFPTADYAHLWWITPLLLICCTELVPEERVRKILKPSLLISILLVNFLFVTDFVAIPRYLVPSTVAKNMYTANLGLQARLEAVAGNISPGKGYFHCAHGIFAVADGKYLPRYPDFVNWGPQSPDKEEQSGKHFYCESKVNEAGLGTQVIWSDPTGNAFITLRE